MLKAADAFHDAGYRVRMISTRTAGWATAADEEIAASRGWRWRVVNYGRAEAPAMWLRSGARHKAARAFANLVTSVPPSVATAAFARVHRELVDAILEEPSELIYGGTTGAIAAAAEAGRRSGSAFAVDFEDYHCAEHESPDGDLSNSLGGLVMRWASEGAAFVTAGSAAIARACRDELAIPAFPIDNAFLLPASPPDRANRFGQREFSAYWFSQTIGAARGLEDIIRALGLTARPASLTLRGCAAPGYIESLRAMAAPAAPRVEIRLMPPAAPARMVDECRAFDLGVSAEQGRVRNRLLSLSNKALTYPLAGLPVALTDTPGHRPLADDLGAGALVFPVGDHETLAGQLLQLMTDRERLAEAGDASWQAARRRWHWEHELERGALLAAAAKAMS
jgi:glycosyltransferase involved in cell wall biosynthesis